jgi:hypothetical protein
LDGEEDPRGLERVDSEYFEDGREQERVERRQPGGGAGVREPDVGEGVGVAVAGDQGAGDSASLPAELEVVFGAADSVGVGEREVEDAGQESDPEDAARGAAGPDSAD